MKRLIKTIALALAAAVAVLATACNPEPETYVEEGISVVFDYNDGSSRPYKVTVGEDESVDEPDEPLRKGYKFSYWQTEENGGEIVVFPYTPTADTTLYAHWDVQTYNVTFDYNYTGSTPYITETVYGSAVEAPTSPIRNGYTFFYWQTQPNGGSEVDFPYTVTGDVTFYANWLVGDVEIYKVTLDLNYEGASAYKTLTVTEGGKILSAQAGKPTRAGYTFSGWAIAPDAETFITFPYTPTEDVTLYAIWKVAQYDVAFRYNYIDSPGTFYQTAKVDGGTQISEPEAPEREGYVFTGWYTTATEGTKFEFPLTITKATSLYAHWQSEPVVTNVFDAEFTVIDNTEKFFGYSSEYIGTQIVLRDLSGKGAHSEPYPENSVLGAQYGHYVSYLTRDKKLTFVINSSAAASNVTLKASLALDAQYATGGTGTWTFASSGENSVQFKVNGTALTYSLTVGVNFTEYTISTNVSLKAGENVIEILIDNGNQSFGGGIIGTAPEIDYIKLDNCSATLSWSPVYDNIYK